MADPGKKRLVISEEDLAAAPPPAPLPVETSRGPAYPPVAPQTPLRAFPAVEGVGPSPVKAPAAVGATVFARSVQGRNLIAAAAGIALAWAVTQVTNADGWWKPHSAISLDLQSALWTGLLGFFFAVVYAGWEQITAWNAEGIKRWLSIAGPLGFGFAFVFGFAAQALYTHFLEQILRSLTLQDLIHLRSNVKLYLVRALGWGMFGVGMGIAVAGGFRSGKKVVNGVLGGAIGGALGGIVFQWCGFNIHSQGFARLVGLLVVGAGIGLAIGIVEKLRRDAWLNITGGPMTGKEFIVYGSTFTFGSSPKCDVTLIKDASVQPFHVVISTVEDRGGQSRILEAYSGCSVSVNGAPAARHQMRSGDVIGIGATAIAYSERAAALV